MLAVHQDMGFLGLSTPDRILFIIPRTGSCRVTSANV